MLSLGDLYSNAVMLNGRAKPQRPRQRENLVFKYILQKYSVPGDISGKLTFQPIVSGGSASRKLKSYTAEGVP